MFQTTWLPLVILAFRASCNSRIVISGCTSKLQLLPLIKATVRVGGHGSGTFGLQPEINLSETLKAYSLNQQNEHGDICKLPGLTCYKKCMGQGLQSHLSAHECLPKVAIKVALSHSCMSIYIVVHICSNPFQLFACFHAYPQSHKGLIDPQTTPKWNRKNPPFARQLPWDELGGTRLHDGFLSTLGAGFNSVAIVVFYGLQLSTSWCQISTWSVLVVEITMWWSLHLNHQLGMLSWNPEITSWNVRLILFQSTQPPFFRFWTHWCDPGLKTILYIRSCSIMFLESTCLT